MFMLAFHVFLHIGEITKRPGAHVDKPIQLQNLKLISRPHKYHDTFYTAYKHQHSNRPVVPEIEAQYHYWPLEGAVFSSVKRMIRGLGVETTSTYSQTLNG